MSGMSESASSFSKAKPRRRLKVYSGVGMNDILDLVDREVRRTLGPENSSNQVNEMKDEINRLRIQYGRERTMVKEYQTIENGTRKTQYLLSVVPHVVSPEEEAMRLLCRLSQDDDVQLMNDRIEFLRILDESQERRYQELIQQHHEILTRNQEKKDIKNQTSKKMNNA